MIVQWYVHRTPQAIEQLIENIEPAPGLSREEEVTERMSDMASRTLQEIMKDVTLGHARQMIAVFHMLIKMRLEELVGERGQVERPWGVHIDEAYMKEPHPGRRVNEARADAAAAVSRAQATIRDSEATAEATRNQAKADRFKREQAAEAATFEERKKGEGERDRIRAMAEAMDTENARFIATLDVAEQVLPKANMVVVPTGGMDVLASILALGKGVK